jgi:hypothetical protein
MQLFRRAAHQIPNAAQARKNLLKQVEQIHRENIRRLAERRLATAQDQGNDGLIQILEAELQQFA